MWSWACSDVVVGVDDAVSVERAVDKLGELKNRGVEVDVKLVGDVVVVVVVGGRSGCVVLVVARVVWKRGNLAV